MPPADPDENSVHAPSKRFTTTRWSVVVAASRQPTAESQEALSALCRTYWYPLYAYVRRQGYNAYDAQDLTQSFFTRLLEKNYLQDVRPERGKFRSFLLASLKHFLSNERDRVLAHKRGGGTAPVSLDMAAAENRYRLEPSHAMTPEKIFERRWALTLLDHAIDRLRQEFVSAGKSEHFDRLKIFLTGEEAPVPYSQMAIDLNLNEGAIKVAVHRLRRRFRAMLREEIARTVADPAEIDDEIRYLFVAISV